MAITYQKFLRRPLDLSPLGLRRGGGYVNYFCTPRGAGMIGDEGVDGIHYCFIRGFGEMVFAVNPENLPGQHVHPIARSFEDLLRLLVSVPHIAAIEQAWRWDKAQFYRFLEENPPTPEQEAVMAALEREFSVEYMEEPFDYVKELQRGFDYGKIKYSPEYYETVGTPEGEEDAAEWQVFYDCGFRRTPVGRSRAGEELPLDGQLVWGEELWRFPALYACTKGFVVDACVALPMEKVSSYLDRWTRVEEEHGVNLVLKDDAVIESPFHTNAWSVFTLNGSELRPKSVGTLTWTPEKLLPAGEENTREARAVLEHYGLDPTQAWTFHRMTCPWATASRPKKLRSLSVKLERCPVTLPGIRFRDPAVGEEFTFVHPISGAEHRLTVREYERQELSMTTGFGNEYEMPTHHWVMTYTLEPELSGAAFGVRDYAPGDEPRRKTTSNNDEFVSIGIIGRADGPTAVLLSSGASLKGHVAVSSLHFTPVDHVEWKTEFREKLLPDVELTLI